MSISLIFTSWRHSERHYFFNLHRQIPIQELATGAPRVRKPAHDKEELYASNHFKPLKSVIVNSPHAVVNGYIPGYISNKLKDKKHEHQKCQFKRYPSHKMLIIH